MAYPDNTARCVFEFGLPNGTLGFVTPHVRSFDGSDLDSGDVQTIASLLKNWATLPNFEGEVNNPLMNFAPDETQLNSITVTSLKEVGPPQWVEPVAVAGAGASTPMPNESALVVTLYTGIVGRRFRGRNFWPILTVNMMENDGTLAAVTTAALQTTFNALIDGLVNDARYVLAVNSAVGLMVNQVVTCQVRDVVHHQRRRNS